ncbi:MAG: FecR domain-containing protein [Bacteroidota bacterium]
MSPAEQANIPWDLIAADLTASASAAQAEALRNWRQAQSQNEQRYQELIKIWKHSQTQLTDYDFDSQMDWPKVAAQLSLPIVAKPLPLWRRPALAWAAMIVLLLGMSVAFWIYLQPPAISWQSVMAASAHQTVILPDGTEVILREGSRLQYPSRFDEDRPVKLEGEAWFAVAKDPEHPFRVQGPKLRVEVLGTRFSVRDYLSDSLSQVDVAEGLVRVVSEDSVQLAAGQSARLQAAKLMEVPQNANFDAWQKGELRFANASLAEVIESLERYYQRPLDTRGSPGEARLNATFSDESLAEVLEVVRLIFQVEVQPR